MRRRSRKLGSKPKDTVNKAANIFTELDESLRKRLQDEADTLNIERIKHIFDLHDDLNQPLTESGLTLLHLAAISNLPVLATVLIEAGASCQVKDSSNKSPFEYALELETTTEELLNLFRVQPYTNKTPKMIEQLFASHSLGDITANEKNQRFLRQSEQQILYLAKAGKQTQDRPTALVLGCGACNEVPVKKLIDLGYRVILVDISTRAAETFVKKLPDTHQEHCDIVQLDLTGQLANIHLELSRISDIKNLLTLFEKYTELLPTSMEHVFSALLSYKPDLIISSLVLSQLALSLSKKVPQSILDNEHFHLFALTYMHTHVKLIERLALECHSQTHLAFTDRAIQDGKVATLVDTNCVFGTPNRTLDKNDLYYFSGRKILRCEIFQSQLLKESSLTSCGSATLFAAATAAVTVASAAAVFYLSN